MRVRSWAAIAASCRARRQTSRNRATRCGVLRGRERLADAGLGGQLPQRRRAFVNLVFLSKVRRAGGAAGVPARLAVRRQPCERDVDASLRSASSAPGSTSCSSSSKMHKLGMETSLATLAASDPHYRSGQARARRDRGARVMNAPAGRGFDRTFIAGLGASAGGPGGAARTAGGGAAAGRRRLCRGAASRPHARKPDGGNPAPHHLVARVGR